MPLVPMLVELRLDLSRVPAAGEARLGLVERGPYPPPAEAIGAFARADGWGRTASMAVPPAALRADGGGLGALADALAATGLVAAAAAHRDHGAGVRLVVEGGGEAVPWGELAAGRLGGAGPLGHPLPVLVRRPGPFAPDAEVRLPLSVGLSWRAGGRPRPAAELLDAFGAEGVRRGVVRLVDDRSLVAPVAVRHLVVDGATRLQALPVRALARARLVVVEDHGPARPEEAAALAGALLDAGAAAVVIADARVDAPAFFQRFYRKLLHDWPLDLALAEALGALPPAAARLWARPGGELAVQLVGIVAARLARAATVELMGVKGSIVTGHGGAAPPPTLAAPPPVAAPRVDRRLDAVRGPLRAAAAHGRAGARELLRHLDDAPRDQEGHFLDQLARADEALAAAEDEAQALDEAAAAVPELDDAAAARSLRAWLAAGDTDFPAQAPLAAARVGTPVRLHVDVGEAVAHTLAAAPLAEAKLKAWFRTHDAASLTVAVYARDADLAVDPPSAPIKLPRVGASSIARFTVTPRVAGRLPLRVCLFHENALLQSMPVVLPVRDAAGHLAGAPPPPATPDWDACPDLVLLDEVERPGLTLFANDAADGTHWIGAWADGAEPVQQLWSFDAASLQAVADGLRAALLAAAGPEAYAYPDAMPVDAATWAERQGELVRLAIAGRRAWAGVFLGDDADGDLPALTAALDRTRRVSLARCRAAAGSVPWAALYRLPLDPALAPEALAVCPVFLADLERNRWEDGGVVAIGDRLDQPEACAADPACPLKDPARRKRTVCPFGFLGVSHELAQPLRHRPPGSTPPAPADPDIPVGAGPIPMFVASNPDLPEVQSHVDALRALREGALAVTADADRDRVLAALEPPATPLVYFYCHCVAEGPSVALELGPGASGAATIEPASVDVTAPWPSAPLVVLNACESLETSPERIGSFLTLFRQVGARGVVGTEVAVWASLARRVGLRVVEGLVDGQRLGATFLALRREMLRELNPLGLAYTFYADGGVRLVRDGTPTGP